MNLRITPYPNKMTITISQRFRIFFYILFSLFITGSSYLFAQEVPVHISNTAVYTFLEEMAEAHLIDISTVTKPWPRKYIAEKLKELSAFREHLTIRQQKELDFYLKIPAFLIDKQACTVNRQMHCFSGKVRKNNFSRIPGVDAVQILF